MPTWMDDAPAPIALRLSLQRAQLGEVHAELRAASIQADPIRMSLHPRFEYAAESSGPSPCVKVRGQVSLCDMLRRI